MLTCFCVLCILLVALWLRFFYVKTRKALWRKGFGACGGLTGSQEVSGSIPLISTTCARKTPRNLMVSGCFSNFFGMKIFHGKSQVAQRLLKLALT